MAKLSKDASLLLKGLIIGKVLTLIVVGGFFWWLWSRLGLEQGFVAQNQTSESIPAFKSQTVTDIPVGSFNYGGSPAWASIRQTIDSQIQAIYPELQLRYVNPTNASPSSNSGIRMLINGQLDLVQSTRPATKQEQNLARQKGFSLQAYPVAIDGVAVVVNPALEVSGLTVTQLQQIFTGEINNWSEIGGKNIPIVPFALPPQDSEAVIFADSAQQQNKLFGNEIQYVNSTTEAVRQVAKTPGGIYFASAKTVVPQCTVKPLALKIKSDLAKGEALRDRTIAPYSDSLVTPQQCPNVRNQVNTKAFENNSYPLTRTMYVIVKKDGSLAQRAGEAYAKLLQTKTGQNAISQAGFASLNVSKEIAEKKPSELQ